MLRGELVNKNCKRDPVCLKCSEGLVTVNSKGARPTELRGELVNRYCMREPVCLKCREGLVIVNSKSSSVCVEGELVNKNYKKSPFV